MNKGLLAAAVLMMSATVGVLSMQSVHCDGFVPENDMYISENMASALGGITEDEFNGVLDRIQKMYDPEAAGYGAKLAISRQWENGTVNASAQQFGRNSWTINMYGGLARHPAVTVDGFALVACHEMGHHLGGAPKSGGWFNPNRWATNEGGADYYATFKCLRRFFSEDDNAAMLSKMDLDPIAVQECEAVHSNKIDQMFCIRGTMAGHSVSALFQDLRSQDMAAKLDTPDQKKVGRTANAHPDTQCRLDTYFAGALCPIAVSEIISKSDYHKGFCADRNMFPTKSLRPRCWFKPNEADVVAGALASGL